VALVDLVDADFAQHVVSRLAADGMRVAVIGAPVAGAQLVLPRTAAAGTGDLTAAIALVEQQLGALCILVCAAGTPARGRFTDTPAAEWFAGVSAALSVPFALIRAAVPALSRTDNARIVVVGAGWSATELTDATATAAVQGALVALVKTLARDLGPRGITVNEVAVPHAVAAGPRALATAVGYLSSANAGAMTGQIITMGSGGDVRP
jgi:3-oxoacyl-[acyl-carrier protein] reductase